MRFKDSFLTSLWKNPGRTGAINPRPLIRHILNEYCIFSGHKPQVKKVMYIYECTSCIYVKQNMMYYIYVLKLLHHHYFDPLERDQRSCGLEREGEIGREGKGRERESVTYDCWEHLNLHQTHLKSPKTRQRETRNTTSTNFNEITGAFVDPYLHPCKERRREIL